MRQQILGVLRKETDVLSGERISDRLGISRVSVWKHIKKLQALGYGIEVTPSGYRLTADSDTPYAWELPERSARIHHHAEVSSTMDVALEMARNKAPHLSVVVADCQTKGRGRMQRPWHSHAGGLYFTVIVRPKIQADLIARLTMGAALVLARVIRERYDIDARLKWPNDILVEGCKLVGMLSQMEAEDDQVAFVNIGIGLNVNNDPRSVEPNATAIKLLLGREVSRKKILAAFLDDFEGLIDGPEGDHVIALWKQNSVTLGQRVRIVTNRETVEGMATDIRDNGALVLQLADGTEKTVVYGDCFHQ